RCVSEAAGRRGFSASAGVAAGCWSAAVAVGLAASAAPEPRVMLQSAVRAKRWIWFIATLLSMTEGALSQAAYLMRTTGSLPPEAFRHQVGPRRSGRGRTGWPLI